MKRNKTVQKSGPWQVDSHSQGRGIVYFMVYPAFPEYDRPDFQWAESRYNEEGGGPSIFHAMAAASELSKFLNSTYPSEAVESWSKRILALLEDEAKDKEIAACSNCGIVLTVNKEWLYCPKCGKKLGERG